MKWPHFVPLNVVDIRSADGSGRGLSAIGAGSPSCCPNTCPFFFRGAERDFDFLGNYFRQLGVIFPEIKSASVTFRLLPESPASLLPSLFPFLPSPPPLSFLHPSVHELRRAPPPGVSSGRPVSWSPPPERRVISLFPPPPGLLLLFVPQLRPPSGCMYSSCVVEGGRAEKLSETPLLRLIW